VARNGYQIFDADTHVGPAAEILARYLTAQEQGTLTSWEPYKAVQRRTGHVTYTRGARAYRRRLGLANTDASATSTGYMAGFTGAHKGQEPSPLVDADPAARIQDMDLEGVDVNLTLPSGWFGTWTLSEDPAVETMMYRAYHRWMDDYCGAFPARITGVILVSARDVARGLEEIAAWAPKRWPLGLFVYAPYGMPLDHPSLEPYWKAAAEYDLGVVLHTFTVMPPYAPGGLDTWDNLWLQRSAAHPWCGMRNMAALIGSGVMDRYPQLRVGTLEAGHSWLPFWMARLDEHAHSIAAALPPLQHKPSDYVVSGRYFQSIEIPEGAQLTKTVIDLLGEDVLMYASDYPHGESWFPKSVETVLGWDLPETTKRKLFWDNAVKFYARYR
jgi:predicted TIM-barrel fold metal-dependent hydrolase